MNHILLACLASLALAACGGASPTPGQSGGDAESDGDAHTCNTAEIAFPIESGCMNDGSVEFCLPADDEAALDAAHAITPLITCTQGSRGRAECDTATERLCLVEVPTSACVAPHGTLTPDAWQMMCALAALPEVRMIVPTFYE